MRNTPPHGRRQWFRLVRGDAHLAIRERPAEELERLSLRDCLRGQTSRIGREIGIGGDEKEPSKGVAELLLCVPIGGGAFWWGGLTEEERVPNLVRGHNRFRNGQVLSLSTGIVRLRVLGQLVALQKAAPSLRRPTP